ncbi:MAG: Fic family protein [Verrucomicrobia bacterium]|nr:Fic family protein [Verrucomicrobiota bacterium]
MTWNWQQADWPNFRYKPEVLAALESRFLCQSGELCGAVKHLVQEDKQVLTVDLISDEALKTAAIEGEYLDRDSLRSSIRRQFGLQVDHRRVPAAEQGLAEMMVNLYETYGDPLTHKTLFAWHAALVKGRRDLAEVGGYRVHDEPMQVVSGPIYEPIIHFEAPPSSRVKFEMDRFIRWFNVSAPDGDKPVAALARAGIAHLRFVSVHPYEDGNGRVGRAIAEKALAQCLRQPTLIVLAYTIERNKRAYYSALARANRDNEITNWLVYFAETVLEAQARTVSRIEFLIAKAKFYDRFHGAFNERQEKVIACLFREGPDGFAGGLSAEKYIRITKTSRATATRDLAELTAKQALKKTGQLKGTRYHLNLGH